VVADEAQIAKELDDAGAAHGGQGAMARVRYLWNCHFAFTGRLFVSVAWISHQVLISGENDSLNTALLAEVPYALMTAFSESTRLFYTTGIGAIHQPRGRFWRYRVGRSKWGIGKCR
jgi:hypothetical protein